MILYLMDTDHISLLHRAGAEGRRIQSRLINLTSETVAFSIVSYEEQLRGWLAEIARARSVTQQEPRYAELDRMRDLYCATPILPFDNAAIAIFQNLWIQRLRVGTMDLKIAAIALANNATLLTRNLSDFSKIPGLNAEDWSR